jgi:hypothetical protein
MDFPACPEGPDDANNGDVMLKAAIASLTALALSAGAPSHARAQATVSTVELGCAIKMGKIASKLSGTVLRGLSKCRDDDIAGKVVGACPSSANLDAFAKIDAKLGDTIEQRCASVCAVSQSVRCIADSLCPARPVSESCSAGAANLPFDMGNLGFPGAYCEGVVGGPLTSPADIHSCVETLTRGAGETIIDAVYGSIDNTSNLPPSAAKCLSTIAKGATKLSGTIYKGVIKCRSEIMKGKVARNPRTCVHDDPKLVAKKSKIEDKVAKLIDAKCTDADILALDLCGTGVGATANRTDATDCIVEIVNELTDTPVVPTLRAFGSSSLIEAAFPPSPVCGDGVVNQLPNPFLLIGEECDGDDDDACPGMCNPPGDVFECTCSNARRQRFIANGFTADLDSGWTGSSHDSGVTDGAGFVLALSNCDCDEMTGPTCTGFTGDPECDTAGRQMPRCSHDPSSSNRCDTYGDNDGRDEHSDCWVCDAYSQNGGGFCAGDEDCTPRCFDAEGTATDPCPGGQANCAPGEVCRGRCDRQQQCLFIPLGAPLPLSSGGTPTCVVNIYREDIFGTRNIVTGEQETFSRHYSLVHLGTNNAVPCPLCGGFCDGGPLDGDTCTGRCTDDASECRFDSDCNPTATCSQTSPECPGGFCNLSLVCRGGPNSAKPCRIGAATPLFGTTSLDCPPSPNQNISGNGLAIDFYPSTSEALSLPFTVPCTATGYELYDCPCPDGGGNKSRPNTCAAACDDGAEYGLGCSTGNSSGQFTRCVGGPNAGSSCDEDSDCAPGTCSHNPTHCLGDPAFDRWGCSTNADCGLGTCVDACPSGRCVPLCVPDPGDPEDGFCAAGPTAYHCNGAKDVFRQCTANQASGGCSATCSISATPCDGYDDCPSGETCTGPCTLAQNCEAGPNGIFGDFDDLPGAGICIADNRNCFLDPIAGEGGDIFNGEGDPANVKAVAVYCIAPTNSTAINASAGLGGAGRLRQNGVNVSSGFTSLP